MRALTKTYGAKDALSVVLDGVDLDIAEGSFTSIVGPSGCGKTTLLRMMAGLQQPSSGEIRTADGVVDGPPSGMVYVFQQYSKSIFPWRTVIDNVMFGLEGDRSLNKAARRALGREHLAMVGLEGVDRHYPSQLSGGMQQRLAIARALAPRPDVLFMDEPFSAVDALTRVKLQRLMLELWEKLELTVVFVTHDIEEALLLSTRVIALGGAPANIDADIAVDLPHPRDHITIGEDPRYLQMRRRLLESIFRYEGLTEPEAVA